MNNNACVIQFQVVILTQQIKTTHMKNTVKKELLTLEEKMKLDPKEVMENGLTREHNEKIENDGELIQGLMGIVSIVIGIYCILQVLR